MTTIHHFFRTGSPAEIPSKHAHSVTNTMPKTPIEKVFSFTVVYEANQTAWCFDGIARP
jgi:hypothetical protein